MPTQTAASNSTFPSTKSYYIPGVVSTTQTATPGIVKSYGDSLTSKARADLGTPVPQMSDKQMNDILNNKSFKITNTGADKVPKATTTATTGSTILDKVTSLFGYNLAGTATAYSSQTGNETVLPTYDYYYIGGAAILLIILMSNNK